MILWRISNYADLAGVGGLRAGGRWHFAGRPVVYLAEHPALALLETLVHHEIGAPTDLPDGYQLLRVHVPDDALVAEFAAGSLPEGWDDKLDWSQGAGSEWLAARRTALLRVPSAVLPHSSNYLLNPLHDDARAVTILEAIQARHDPRVLSLLARGIG